MKEKAPSVLTGSEAQRRVVILDAIAQAQGVLPFFEAERPTDDRPRQAIVGAEAWCRGDIKIGAARVLAIAAHAAAREAKHPAAIAAARAAAHAAATAHMAGHAPQAAAYATKARAAQ
jgi:hypothetical protein